jgi:hypothetical protein
LTLTARFARRSPPYNPHYNPDCRIQEGSRHPMRRDVVGGASLPARHSAARINPDEESNWRFTSQEVHEMRIVPILLLGTSISFASKDLSAQFPSWITALDLMSAEDFRATGLHKLTPEEIAVLDGWLGETFIRLMAATQRGGADADLTEAEVEDFFRRHTVCGNHAAAIKLRFTIPQPGTAYLGTIHGYPNNLQVCEGLIEPYNDDPSFTVIPGARYFCEVLRL